MLMGSVIFGSFEGSRAGVICISPPQQAAHGAQAGTSGWAGTDRNQKRAGLGHLVPWGGFEAGSLFLCFETSYLGDEGDAGGRR